MCFARRFKRLRFDAGLSQEEVASSLGISRATVAGYESEIKRRIPEPDTLLKIANLFQVSLDYLLGYNKINKSYELKLRQSSSQTNQISLSTFISEILNTAFDELALTQDDSQKSKHGLNLTRIKELVSVAAEILELLQSKTNGAREARFVAAFVKGALDHWHSDVDRK